jgi:FkbM family methyltransferase
MLTLRGLSQLSQQLLPARLDQLLRDVAYRRGRRSFSQEGEDLILERHFEHRPAGFYVDVGAHHPFRFSNTYSFYRKGWRGLNIDAAPGGMQKFRRHRQCDINLEIGIAEHAASIPFYIFDEPALSTFDAATARQRNVPPRQLLRTVELRVEPLAAVLRRHLPLGQRIAFLSVDVEGKDMEVLRSNDWDAFRPEVVVVETMSEDIDALMASPHHRYLLNKGYAALAKSVHSSFYIDRTHVS